MTRYQRELEKIRKAHAGRLHPKHVVEAARSKSSPLHGKFDWNDTSAAAKYRLQQASELIREVMVTVEGVDEPVRRYVSVSADRLGSGGYRAMTEVLSDASLLAQLKADALAELQSFKQRYSKLNKLKLYAQVFEAIEIAIKEAA